jgi:hypothetical protein
MSIVPLCLIFASFSVYPLTDPTGLEHKDLACPPSLLEVYITQSALGSKAIIAVEELATQLTDGTGVAICFGPLARWAVRHMRLTGFRVSSSARHAIPSVEEWAETSADCSAATSTQRARVNQRILNLLVDLKNETRRWN